MNKPLELTPDPFALELWRDRNAAPRMLYEAWKWKRISTDDLKHWILHVWEAAEFPVQLGQARWLEMFAATGYVTDGWDGPPEFPLTVYRGAPAGKPRGMSWSWDPYRAEWFANRLELFGLKAEVYAVTLPQELLLGCIGGTEGRSEHEAIVNPRRLRGQWTPEVVTGASVIQTTEDRK